MHKQESIKHGHTHIHMTQHSRHTHSYIHIAHLSLSRSHTHSQTEGKTGRESVQGQPSLLSQGRVNIPASTKPLTCLGRPAESLLSASRPTPHLNAMLLIQPLSISPPLPPSLCAVHLHMKYQTLNYADSLSVTKLHIKPCSAVQMKIEQLHACVMLLHCKSVV